MNIFGLLSFIKWQTGFGLLAHLQCYADKCCFQISYIVPFYGSGTVELSVVGI